MFVLFSRLVENPAVMNRKLLEKKTSICNENANYSSFILLNKFELNFGLLLKIDAKSENKTKSEIARKPIRKGNKIWAAGSR